MITIYLCDRHPFGECPFPCANCNDCVPEIIYEEDDMITLKTEEET